MKKTSAYFIGITFGLISSSSGHVFASEANTKVSETNPSAVFQNFKKTIEETVPQEAQVKNEAEVTPVVPKKTAENTGEATNVKVVDTDGQDSNKVSNTPKKLDQVESTEEKEVGKVEEDEKTNEIDQEFERQKKELQAQVAERKATEAKEKEAMLQKLQEKEVEIEIENKTSSIVQLIRDRKEVLEYEDAKPDEIQFEPKSMEDISELHNTVETGTITPYTNNSQVTPRVSGGSHLSIKSNAIREGLDEGFRNDRYNSFTPEETYTGFKGYEQSLIVDVIQDEKLVGSLDKTLALMNIQKMTDKLETLNKQYVQITQRKSDIDDNKKQLLLALVLTNRSITQNKKSIGERILNIQELEEDIQFSRETLERLYPDLIEAEKNLKTYMQVYYKMNHDIFTYSDGSGNLSSLKLYGKHDNVAEKLAEDLMVNELTKELQSLVETLGIYRAKYAIHFKKNSQHLEELESEIDAYSREKPMLEQQIGNFEEFIGLINSNTEYIETQQSDIEAAKALLGTKDDLVELMEEATTKEEITTVKKFAGVEITDESRFFQFPVDEILKFTSFFEDEGYANHFRMSHNAIDFRLAQGSFVYSPAPGYVYKVIDQESPRLNWFIVLHQNNFATVYLHMQDTYVETGTFVETGEILGLSGGTPGTRGAGFMTTGPHLHREVWKNGVVVDPLMYTDLSLVPSADMVQNRHKEKRARDSGK